tara:strand:- start:1792 stop:3240 length:1449 start_codon:yes stop_codon:yes gene_type:complete
MLFNSIDFAIFLPIVFILYWFVAKNSIRIQNLLIIIASYTFYGWWDWRFLSLILLSTIVDYTVGVNLKSETQSFKRKLLLSTSIVVNLGLLAVFKYYNFFLENFANAFSLVGLEINTNTLNIILPVGISFYTFQTLSYTIDIYRKKIIPTKDFIAFSAFVCFFPQLVAGPIERATNLLPQFFSKRTFKYNQAVDGMRQILWGLFKKIVIADNCAEFANLIFNNSSDYSGSTLLLGAIFFTFQIYGDFSGYSDIAIGTSRLFGFNLKQNFATPYFSRDIAEFWRRWHISLSSWFRDYLYIPIGGSVGGSAMKIRNTFAIFLISGFWHGANWTFVAWGAINAIYFLPLLLTKNNRKYLDIVAKGKTLPSIRESISMISTFLLTVFAWIFFRAENITHALQYISGVFSYTIFEIPIFKGRLDALITLFLIVFFMLVEWKGRGDKFAIEKILHNYKSKERISIYIVLIIMIFLFSNNAQDFIYFQF